MKRLLLIAITLLTLATNVVAQQPKPIYKESSFWFNVAGTAGDMITSLAIIDGQHVREGNPLLRAADGRVSIPKIAASKALSLGVPALIYHFNKNAGRKAMWAVGTVQLGVTAGNIAVGFRFRF